ncbi:hypothetical protein D869_gp321 [Caulobacter phage CcrRogue]|uniref:Uncharacterized protein n=2 Tax=Poindextervirus TaxID=2733154 RepID=K4JS74_9CAUD|nr:hypothetical protein D869_gp321 [Caulobacter phage CcrRogue]YP_009808939.1 hypothetical protein HOT99_gp308 [Caulobacter phage CcrBL10]AFU86593.1 hypothetical protein CcrRogue_gp111 [Caulobacter phage CcrRogue]AXQ68309.1 hypothetical protein CcrBL10_gp105c [Caulobacter phage CcrBL10]
MTSPTEDFIPVREEVITAQSVLALTESPTNPGGFTIGLSLASFNEADGETIRIPVVDIVILALVNILKDTPDVFKAEVDKINTAVSDLSAQIASGQDVDAALDKFRSIVGVQGVVR